MSSLDFLLKNFFYDLKLLQNSFDEWIKLDKDYHTFFIEKRIELAQNYQCTFYDYGIKLNSSGSSSGRIRKYLWGPCFDEQFKFFEWIKFRDIDYNKILYLKIHWGKIPFKNLELNIEKHELISVNYHYLLNNIDNLIKIIHKHLVKDKKIILWICPIYLKHLISINFPFDNLDKENVILYSTGEILDKEIINFLNNKKIRIIDAMRCWDGGATFITCQYNNKHWIDLLSKIEFDENNNLISSDFFNLAQNFIKYKNGDKILNKRTDKQCECGLFIDNIDFIQKSYVLFPIKNKFLNYSDLKMMFTISCKELRIKGIISCNFAFNIENQHLFVFFSSINDLDNNIIKQIKNLMLKRISEDIQINIHNFISPSFYKERKMFLMNIDEYNNFIQQNNKFNTI